MQGSITVHVLLSLVLSAPAFAVENKELAEKAYYFLKLGEDAQAMAVCEQALAREPNNLNLLLLKAHIQIAQDAPKAALSTCAKARIVAAKSSEQPFYVEAEAYSAAGELDKAIKAISAAIVLAPENIDARRMRACFHLKQKDYSAAVADFSFVISKEESKISQYKNTIWRDFEARGSAYLGQKDYQRAVDDFTALLSSRIAYPRGYRLRAEAFEAMGKKAEAQQDRGKAEASDMDWGPGQPGSKETARGQR
jgi:tetratricopeptide (TPR) repeat protein